MTKMTTLGQVSDKVKTLSIDCTDIYVKTSKVTFGNIELVKIEDEPHYLRPVAQSQIAYRLGIPIQYLRKCPKEVQAYNMNHWIEKERNEELFFRFDSDEVRAIFTPRYVPVDNHEVLEKLDIFGYDQYTEVQCFLDNEFLTINIPDPERTFYINGDSMKQGISISNSEVGLSSLSVSAFILRLVCTNGMISTTDVRESYKHVSMKVIDRFSDALFKATYDIGKYRDQFRLSLESKVDDLESTFKSFNKRFQINKDEKEAIEWAWPLEEGDTMFNVINTYTRASQCMGLSAESSYRLQRVGGMILEMVR